MGRSSILSIPVVVPVWCRHCSCICMQIAVMQLFPLGCCIVTAISRRRRSAVGPWTVSDTEKHALFALLIWLQLRRLVNADRSFVYMQFRYDDGVHDFPPRTELLFSLFTITQLNPDTLNPTSQ